MVKFEPRQQVSAFVSDSFGEYVFSGAALKLLKSPDMRNINDVRLETIGAIEIRGCQVGC